MEKNIFVLKSIYLGVWSHIRPQNTTLLKMWQSVSSSYGNKYKVVQTPPSLSIPKFDFRSCYIPATWKWGIESLLLLLFALPLMSNFAISYIVHLTQGINEQIKLYQNFAKSFISRQGHVTRNLRYVIIFTTRNLEIRFFSLCLWMHRNRQPPLQKQTSNYCPL